MKCNLDDNINPFAVQKDYGVSEDASSLIRRFMDIFIDSIDSRRTITVSDRFDKFEEAFNSIIEECSDNNWNGYNARPVDTKSITQARRFLNNLPLSTPLPDISIDADGEITLEWHGGPHRVLYLSIGANGQINYACIVGATTSKGIEFFENEPPATILHNIKKVHQ
ncbi:MAG: hypothetical protein WC562_09505 [Dehalococcoidia bacterium]